MTQYDPNGLLDEVAILLGTKNDAALSRALGVAPPVLSKIRHGRLNFGPSLMVKCHETAGNSFPTMRGYVPAVAA